MKHNVLSKVSNAADHLRALFVCLVFCILLCGNTLAQDEVLYDQYTLQASAEGEVANDLMIVRLQVEHEDREIAKLASKINADMAWALAELAAFDRIEAATGNYNTHPLYEQNRVVGWRSSQTLNLQGEDFDQLKDALQTLQGKLKVQQMLFQAQDETRKELEDTLISEALDNFKRRSVIVQENMGAASYRVMQININTGGRGRARLEQATLARSVESAPAVEAGQSRITVNISGQIQLQ